MNYSVEFLFLHIDLFLQKKDSSESSEINLSLVLYIYLNKIMNIMIIIIMIDSYEKNMLVDNNRHERLT